MEYLLKWKDVSYLHVEWVTAALMREYRQWGVGRMKRMVESEDGQVQEGLACIDCCAVLVGIFFPGIQLRSLTPF